MQETESSGRPCLRSRTRAGEMIKHKKSSHLASFFFLVSSNKNIKGAKACDDVASSNTSDCQMSDVLPCSADSCYHWHTSERENEWKEVKTFVFFSYLSKSNLKIEEWMNGQRPGGAVGERGRKEKAIDMPEWESRIVGQSEEGSSADDMSFPHLIQMTIRMTALCNWTGNSFLQETVQQEGQQQKKLFISNSRFTTEVYEYQSQCLLTWLRK